MCFRAILRVLLVAAITGGTFALGAIPAQAATVEAGPICAEASASSAAGDFGTGAVCVPYSGSVLCHSVTITGGTLATVRASACHPW